MPEPPVYPRDRLLHAVSRLTGVTPTTAARLRTVPLADPELLREAISKLGERINRGYPHILLGREH